MGSFDLNAYGVKEMTYNEMLIVDGGNVFEDAWNWIKGAAQTVASWFSDAVKEYGEQIAVAVLTALATAGAKELFNFK
jgi:hypothetical protein